MKEYHYPDFMPKPGELVLVRDYSDTEWQERYFYRFEVENTHPWRMRGSLYDSTGWKYCASVAEKSTSAVPYTENDQPIPGQPILVKGGLDDTWQCRIFYRYVANAQGHWETIDRRRWYYAAHYDEQFWLTQQKKKEKREEAIIKAITGASPQAKKLADELAKRCRKGKCIYDPAMDNCPLKALCFRVTKDDWLAWTAEQED